MSNNDVEKLTKEILGDSKSATAKALVVVAMSMDNMTAAVIDNQKKVNEQIIALEIKLDKKLGDLNESTNKRFDKLKFFSVISDFWWIGVLIIVALIVLIIWSVNKQDPTVGIKLFK